MSDKDPRLLDDRLDEWADDAGSHPQWFTPKVALGITLFLLIVVIDVHVATTGRLFFQTEVPQTTAGARATGGAYNPATITQVRFFEQQCRYVATDWQEWRTGEADLQRTKQKLRSGVITDPTDQRLAQSQSHAVERLTALYSDVAAYNAVSGHYMASAFKTLNLPYRIYPPAGAALSTWTPPSCGDRHERELVDRMLAVQDSSQNHYLRLARRLASLLQA